MSLDNLPVEWLNVKISDVTVKGEQRKPNDSEEFIYVDIGSINRDLKKIESPQFLLGKDAPSRARKVIKSGDILVSLTRPNLNAVALVGENYDQQIASTGFEVISPMFVESKYLFSLVRTQNFINEISKQEQGALYPAAKSSDVQAYEFPLPPLAEQQEIVRQLDVMLAQVEQIKARLDAIPALLKKFRQSVLADAVSGKLTEGANCSKWIKSTIGAEFKCIDGDRGKNYPKKEDYQTEGYCLFLSTKNVRKFGFLFDDKVFISKQKHEQLRNGTLERDDLIITTRGTLGHIASYDKNVPFDVVRINSGMLILRKTKQNLLNEFMMLLLASPKFQRIIEEQRTGSAQPQLPAKILKEFEIELPSLDEQKLIVQKVESYFELIEKTEDTVQSAQKRVNLLTQSILAKAFSGELTAEWREQHQDLITGVNSAEALLAKIQKEREASKPVKKAKKVK